jgi:hypothetical protein
LDRQDRGPIEVIDLGSDDATAIFKYELKTQELKEKNLKDKIEAFTLAARRTRTILSEKS